MSTVRIQGSRVGGGFRPAVERLEDRTVPASLISSTGNAFAGADAPVELLGVSDDGAALLVQSTATNLVAGQADVPGTNDLFYFNRSTGQRTLITAFDPPAGSLFTAGTKAIGASRSTPGVLLNAVLSADGFSVAFMSGTDATSFDSTIANVQDGGGEDLFVYDSRNGQVTLGSKDARGFALGSYALVNSPSISSDGKSIAFVSTTSAHFSYDTKFLIVVDPAIPHGFGRPNLYRSDVGATPSPVSYIGPFIDGSYFFYDDVSVDPLGRYASADGVSYVTMNDNSNSRFFFGLPGQQPTTQTFGKDVTRFTFAGAGFGNSPLQDVVSTTVDGFALGANNLGTVTDAIVARDRSDIVLFTATVTGGTTGGGFFPTFPPITSFSNGFLVPGYVNQNGTTPDLYRATFAGRESTIELISKAAGTANTGLNGALDPTPGSIGITPNGLRALFVSSGSNAVAGLTDKNKAFDVFQRNTEAGVTTAISVTAGNPNRTGFGASRNPSMTTDGLLVAFESDANDVSATPDANGQTDIYVRDLTRRTTALASAVSGSFAAGNGRSVTPLVGGTFLSGQLYFQSTSTDLDRNAKVADGVGQIYDALIPIVVNNLTRVVGFAGGPNGFASIGKLDIDGNLIQGTRFQPFGRFAGELRVATGDYTGDGVPDLVVGAGVGGGPRVQVIDGFNGRVVLDFFAFESRFTGGVYVALGDFNADGRADLIVGAGELGGPRVQVYDARSKRLIVDRFAFEPESRVGVHVAAGDYTGDGLDDLIVAAGNGGGPRVRIFDGDDVTRPNAIADFFASDPTERAGVYVSAADFDNDGRADIVAATGPGVQTRVRIYNAANLLLRDPNVPITFRDFTPFGEGDTGGARAVLRDIEGQLNADVVVANATGLPRIMTYAGNSVGTTAGTPQARQQIIPFDALSGEFGAYVG